MSADRIRQAARALRTRSAEAGQRYDGTVVLSQGEALAVADVFETIALHDSWDDEEHPSACFEDVARVAEKVVAILRGQS